jgi:hypothetical protein
MLSLREGLMPFRPKPSSTKARTGDGSDFIGFDTETGTSYFWLAGGLPNKPLGYLTDEEKNIAWKEAAKPQKIVVRTAWND